MQNIKVKCRYYVQIIFLTYEEELILCNCKINADIRQKYETVLDLSAFVLMIFYSSICKYKCVLCIVFGIITKYQAAKPKLKPIVVDIYHLPLPIWMYPK